MGVGWVLQVTSNYLPKVKVWDETGYHNYFSQRNPGSTEESWPFEKKFPSKNDGLRACVKLGVSDFWLHLGSAPGSSSFFVPEYKTLEELMA